MTPSDAEDSVDSVSTELDHLVVAQLEGVPLDNRSVEAHRCVYQLGSSEGRSVEIGHEHAAHLWLTIAGSWQADEVGDAEDLAYMVPIFVEAARRYLHGVMDPDPQARRSWFSRQRVWKVDDLHLAFRELR